MMLFGGRSGKLKDSCSSSDIQEANARNHIQKRSYNPWGKSTESETNLEVLLCAQIGWYGWFTFCESMSPPAPTSMNQKRARSLPSCTRSVAVWTRSTGFLYGCIRRHVRIGTDTTDHMEDRGTHLGPLQLSPWMPVKELAPPSGARKATLRHRWRGLSPLGGPRRWVGCSAMGGRRRRWVAAGFVFPGKCNSDVWDGEERGCGVGARGVDAWEGWHFMLNYGHRIWFKCFISLWF